MNQRSPISVVIPTRNRPDLLEGCLKNLRRSLGEQDELIVVDSASTDERVRDVALAGRTTYVRCELPGSSRARNEGWRRASHEVVAFIDDDIEVDAHWADTLARTFDSFPEAAFLTGSIGYPPGDRPEFPVAEMNNKEPFVIDRDCAIDPGHSANFAVRRTALEAVGGFDELMGGGAKYRAAEDKDIIDRLIVAGYEGRYEPAARTIHLDWRSRNEVIGLNWTYGLGSGVRMTKLLKADRGRFLQQARILFWTWGLEDLGRSIKWRSKFLVLVVTVRLIGMCLGMLWALPVPVRNGHFRGRRLA